MGKILLKLAAACSIGAVVAALAAGPALAAATWTVTHGGTGLPTAATTVTLTAGSSTITCTGTAAITMANGSGRSGTDLGTIAFSYSACTGPLTLSSTVTQVGTAKLNAMSYSNGTTTGTITGLELDLSATSCTAEIAGTVAFSYANSTGDLTVSTDGSLLTVKSAACLGLLTTGEVVGYSAVYALTDTPLLHITSP